MARRQDELRFLLGVSLPDDADGRNGEGRRVELNAMTSPQFIERLERKLKEHGVEKVVPDKKVLEAAWQRAEAFIQLEDSAEQIRERKPETPPKDLEQLTRETLAEEPQLSWDRALMKNVRAGHEELNVRARDREQWVKLKGHRDVLTP
jgi:hypothetical protein